jgi:hypothetical protein
MATLVAPRKRRVDEIRCAAFEIYRLPSALKANLTADGVRTARIDDGLETVAPRLTAAAPRPGINARSDKHGAWATPSR